MEPDSERRAAGPAEGRLDAAAQVIWEGDGDEAETLDPLGKGAVAVRGGGHVLAPADGRPEAVLIDRAADQDRAGVARRVVAHEEDPSFRVASERDPFDVGTGHRLRARREKREDEARKTEHQAIAAGLSTPFHRLRWCRLRCRLAFRGGPWLK